MGQRVIQRQTPGGAWDALSTVRLVNLELTDGWLRMDFEQTAQPVANSIAASPTGRAETASAAGR